METNRGPRTDPCGTSHLRGSDAELLDPIDKTNLYKIPKGCKCYEKYRFGNIAESISRPVNRTLHLMKRI